MMIKNLFKSPSGDLGARKLRTYTEAPLVKHRFTEKRALPQIWH
jgi:hypothetical protein